MKIKIKAEELRRVAELESIISERQPQEILSHILFETVSENAVKLFATNLETALEITLPCNVLEAGNISMSANKIGGIVRNLGFNDINILTDADNKIKIYSGNFKTTLQGYSKDDFPVMKKTAGKSISFSEVLFKQLLRECSFSALKENTGKEFLKGVFLNFSPVSTTAVSSDGFRLIEREWSTLKNDISENISFILPSRAANEIQKIKFNYEIEDMTADKINIEICDAEIIITSPTSKYSSRLVDAEYPNYRHIIPEFNEKNVLIPAAEIMNALTLIQNSSTDNRAIFEFANKKLVIKSSNDTGESEFNLDVEKDFALTLPIKINYLLEYIKIIKPDNIHFSFTSEKTPILIGALSTKYVLMPMRY
jgi:DNA polymerase III subunit beta